MRVLESQINAGTMNTTSMEDVGRETVMEQYFIAAIEQIAAELRTAGYEPDMQLYGYAATGDESYITRRGNARQIISRLDRELIMQYIVNKYPDKFI